MPFLWLPQHNDQGKVRHAKQRFERAQYEPKIGDLRLDRLREAIRANRISFPAQAPIFEKHDRPDLQRQIVQLVLGWTCDSIAARYGLIRQRAQQILHSWKRCAAEMGYLQHIPPLEVLVSAFAMRRSKTVPAQCAAPSRFPAVAARKEVF